MISLANTMLLKAEKQPALMTNIPVITNRTLTGATNLVPFREIIRLTLNRPINEPNASPYITNPAGCFSFTRHAGQKGKVRRRHLWYDDK
ncbi:hypothetical protein ACSE3M_13965 [Bacillus velezensis]